MHQLIRSLLILATVLLLALPAHAFEQGTFLLESQDTGGTHKLAVGARYQDRVTSVSGLPFEKGDLSWLLAYEYHESIAFWQFALGYAPESTTDNDAKVITPQINLIFKDGIYRLGTGALKSYVDLNGETDWTQLYWQIIAGLEFPLGSRASLGIYGYYVFNKWDRITKTDDNGLEGSLFLSWAF